MIEVLYWIDQVILEIPVPCKTDSPVDRRYLSPAHARPQRPAKHWEIANEHGLTKMWHGATKRLPSRASHFASRCESFDFELLGAMPRFFGYDDLEYAVLEGGRRLLSQGGSRQGQCTLILFL